MRRKLFLSVLVFALFHFYQEEVSGQWKLTNGPYSGQVTSLAKLGTMTFAGSKDGVVYRSLDSGVHWAKFSTLPQSTSLYDFGATSLGSNLLASGVGLYLSADSGLNWRYLKPGGMNSSDEYIGLNDSEFFVATEHGLFRSKDLGNNWTSLFWAAKPRALAVEGHNVYIVVDPDTALHKSGGLFRSFDDGLTWTSLDTGFYEQRVSLLTTVGSTLLAFRYGIGLLRSSDSGTTWGPPIFAPYSEPTAMTTAGSTIFLSLFEQGLFTSVDAGKTWLPNSGPASFITSSLLIRNDAAGNLNVLFAATDNSLQRSSDRGVTWWSVDTGMGSTIATDLLDRQGRVFAATPVGLFRSTNLGASWDRAPGPPGLLPAYSIIATDSFLLMRGYAPFVTDVNSRYRSSDNGDTWDSLGYAGNGQERANMKVIVEWGGFGSGSVKSTDNGRAWSDLDTAIHPDLWWIPGVMLGEDIIIADVDSADQFKKQVISRDVGATWQDLHDDPFMRGIFAEEHSTAYSQNSTDTSLYRSRDNFQSWQKIYHGGSLTNFAVRRNIVVAVYSKSGVLLSFNQGDTWDTINAGLPNTDVGVIAIGDSNLYLALNATPGIYRYPFPATASVAASRLFESNSIKCFPNPTSTNIHVELTDPTHQAITVLDVLGRTRLKAAVSAGSNSLDLDIRQLESGTYFLRTPSEGATFVVAR